MKQNAIIEIYTGIPKKQNMQLTLNSTLRSANFITSTTGLSAVSVIFQQFPV